MSTVDGITITVRHDCAGARARVEKEGFLTIETGPAASEFEALESLIRTLFEDVLEAWPISHWGKGAKTHE